jgi:hypothetical protein
MSIIKAVNLDLNKLTFSDVKTDNHGRKMVYVNYNGGKIMVQTPKMYVPNGIKRWRKKDAVDNKDDSFEMELSFGGEDNTDKNSTEIKTFHEKLEQFDEMVKKTIMAKSKEWLGKPKVSMETIEDAYYSPSVRIPTDKDGNILDYPSRVRVKLDRERENDSDNFTGRFLSNKRFKTPVLMFDDSKNQIEMNESNFDLVVPKGSQVICVLELVYLSITSKISPKWKLVQAKVFKNQQSITGYAMLDEESEGIEDLDTENEVVEATKALNVSDSEIEEVETEGLEAEGLEEEVEESETEGLEEELEPEPVAPKVEVIEPPKVEPKVTKGRTKRGVVA